MEFAVILVDSTSLALRIEQLMKREGLSYKLISVPRHLSSDCGFCVRILKEDCETVQNLLQENKIEIQSIEVL
jgi:hypothetical protein